MTLLEEIQAEAVDASSDLGNLLRKCKLLGARLGSQPLEDWLIWESNGYPKDVNVPDYRIWPLMVRGHFTGPFGSGLRNALIPWSTLPESAQDAYQNYECRQSIAVIEAMLTKNKDGLIRVSTGDLAMALGSNVYQHQNCLDAWAEFGTNSLVELINSVRNRLLDFVLAVWKEEPTAGDPGSDASRGPDAATVSQIFNMTIYGGATNLVGAATGSTVTFNVVANDLPSLERALSEQGVSDDDIADLKTALDEDETPTSAGAFGPRVSSWIAAMVKKAADGAWGVGVGAAGAFLAQAITKYYGL